MSFKRSILYILLIFLFGTSCIPRKNIIYFQGAENQNTIGSVPLIGSQDYEYIIGPTDVLGIEIDGVDDAVFAAFRPVVEGVGGVAGRIVDRGLLVNKYGQIELPVLGKVNVSGLTLAAAADTLKSRLSLYVTDTTLVYVNVRTLTYQVTVLGEVRAPGIYQADNNFMTITELLAKSGDLTDFSNRKNIKLYRTDRATQLTTVYQLDLTRGELVQPILTRLQPNDVIYVEPLPRKQYQSGITIIGFGTTLLSVGFFILTLIDNLR